MSPIAPFLAPERDDDFKRGRPKASGGTVYYTLPGHAISATSSTSNLSVDTDYYFPVFVHTPIRVDQMAFEVTTGSAGNARVGLYLADLDLQPIGAPLTDSGNIDVTSTGVKTYTPGTPVYLARGRYLTVMNTSAAPGLRRAEVPTGFAVPTSFGSTPIGTYTVARTYAAFPTPGTRWDTAATASRCWVLLRVLTP